MIASTSFIQYNAGCYIYQRNNQNYSIASAMLNSLFVTYGYCVDPVDKTGLALSPDNIVCLHNLATIHKDRTLLDTLNNLRHNKSPSPRLINDNIMNEITLNDKHRFTYLPPDNQHHTLILLQNILHIGLYLGGWKGLDEPYIFQLKPVTDTVRVELKIFPIIQALHNDQAYSIIKNFPIIEYYHSGNSGMLKPSIIDTTLTIDKCLNQISMGLTENYNKLASYFIATAYYYITTICNNPLPMIDPLIHSLTTNISNA